MKIGLGVFEVELTRARSADQAAERLVNQVSDIVSSHAAGEETGKPWRLITVKRFDIRC